MYKIIQFLDETIQGKRSVDIVCSSYIRYDDKRKSLVSKFKPPPYEKEDFNLITFMIQQQHPAPNDWEEYRIKILGEAETYTAGKKKLLKLNTEEYAFSTDSEIPKSQQAEACENFFKLQTAIIDEENITIIDVPSLEENCEAYVPDIPVVAYDPQIHYKPSKSKYTIQRKYDSEENIFQENVTVPSSCANYTPTSSFSNNNIINNCNRKGSCKRMFDDQDGQRKKKKENNRTINTLQDTSNIQMLPITNSSIDNAEQANLNSIYKIVLDIGTKQEAMREDINSIKREIRDISRKLTTVDPDVPDIINSDEKNLPINTLEEFLEFDEKLNNDVKLHTDIVKVLKYAYDKKDDIKKNIKRMLQAIITKNVAMHFNAVKATDKKKEFISTKLSKLLEETLKILCNKGDEIIITNKLYNITLGNVLTNSYDWAGGRSERRNKNKQ